MSFTPRLEIPKNDNKYYITKDKGGYSNAIKGICKDTGKPHPYLNVLGNCVGYVYGRVNEIGGYKCCKYLSPVNAENFPEYAKGLKTGSTPKLGAVIVWQKGKTLKSDDGCGHVAVVERIISDTQILISQSGYNSKPFWTEIVTLKNGNWTCSWMGSTYKFRCFIYNPAVDDKEAEVITLMNGSKGNLVKALQNNLNTVGNYKLEVDGCFGPLCEKAVKDFQKKNGLNSDGIVGPATTVTLNNLVEKCKKPKGVTDLTFMLDNKKVTVWATCIEGNNYVRLADLDDIKLVKSVEYDSVKKMPVVKTK